MITDALERGGDLLERADVCVVGSGAGGAVVASELAAAGLSVVVLEQGHHWTSADFTQREEEMLPRLFEEGGMRQTVDGGVIVKPIGGLLPRLLRVETMRVLEQFDCSASTGAKLPPSSLVRPRGMCRAQQIDLQR